ncbi:MAG: hypothetical protein ACRC6V_03565 [Bacteroidales bacterium]
MKLLLSLSGSPVLYHILDIQTATSVLKNNEFVLASSGGTDAERNLHSADYYLSTTRHNLGKYSVSGASTNKVIFTLDGTKLGNNHKIIPVDYWGESFRKSAGGDYEAEDRVLSNKPTITNARKFILSARVLIGGTTGPSWNRRNSSDNRFLRRLAIQAKRHNIPLNIYYEAKDFLMDNKAKAVSIRTIDLTVSGKESHYASRGKSYLAPYLELYNRNDRAHLSNDAKDLLYSMHGRLPQEKAVSFKNDMHMERSSRVPKQRRAVEELITIMRKNSLDPVSFLSLIIAKWKAIK